GEELYYLWRGKVTTVSHSTTVSSHGCVRIVGEKQPLRVLRHAFAGNRGAACQGELRRSHLGTRVRRWGDQPPVTWGGSIDGPGGLRFWHRGRGFSSDAAEG